LRSGLRGNQPDIDPDAASGSAVCQAGQTLHCGRRQDGRDPQNCPPGKRIGQGVHCQVQRAGEAGKAGGGIKQIRGVIHHRLYPLGRLIGTRETHLLTCDKVQLVGGGRWTGVRPCFQCGTQHLKAGAAVSGGIQHGQPGVKRQQDLHTRLNFHHFLRNDGQRHLPSPSFRFHGGGQGCQGRSGFHRQNRCRGC